MNYIFILKSEKPSNLSWGHCFSVLAVYADNFAIAAPWFVSLGMSDIPDTSPTTLSKSMQTLPVSQKQIICATNFAYLENNLKKR